MSSQHRWHPVVGAPVGLVRPVRLDPLGLDGPTKKQAEGRSWRRTGQGWYVPATAAGHVPEQRILEQSVRLNEVGAVTGWAACRLWGAAFFDGLSRDGHTQLPVPLAVGPQGHLATHPSSFPLHHVLLPGDRTVRHGIPTAIPERAAFDAIRLAPDRTARVVAADMALAGQITSRQLIAEYAAHQPHQRALVLGVLASASEHSRSPRESELRIIAEDGAGLRDLLVNARIHDLHGALLGVADLLDARAGLVVELDGADHGRAARRASDNRRAERMSDVGLVTCRVVGHETSSPDLVAARLRRARQRARFCAPHDRQWFAVPREDSLHDLVLQRRALWTKGV